MNLHLNYDKALALAKIKAASLHLLLTMLVGLACAILVFYVWYPWPYYEILDGMRLFLLVTVSDLILGPLITLVIYTPKKNRAILIRDYVVVIFVQVAALAYGMHIVAAARPVFLVFAVDGFDVVAANDLKNRDIVSAKLPQYSELSWLGPRAVWAEVPVDPKEKTELMFSALNGKDIQFQPKYFKSIEEGHDFISKKGEAIDRLLERHPHQEAVVRKTLMTIRKADDELIWFPVRGPESIWTVFLDRKTLSPLLWMDIDPY